LNPVRVSNPFSTDGWGKMRSPDGLTRSGWSTASLFMETQLYTLQLNNDTLTGVDAGTHI